MGESRIERTVLGVRPAGRRRARRHARARAGAGVALALGLAAVLGAWLWPLPAPPDAVVAAPPQALGDPAWGDDLESRERRLRALASGGNIFAPDRAPWPEEAPAVEVASGDEASPSAPPPPPAERPLPDRAQEVRLTERPSAAAQQSRDQLALRGLLVSGGRRMAMIQGGVPRERDRVELYREGDVFLKETWRLVRIDDRRDRVILEHLGQGDVMELTLYDAAATLAAAEPPADGGVGVARATEIDARRDMLEAGVDRDDVDELFDMMARLERGEDVEAEAIEPEREGAAGGASEAAPSPDQPATRGPAREMPPGMAELLRSMMRDAARSRSATEEDGGSGGGGSSSG